nr:integrase, catalytic region, zinc finger, CCHC-type, peptidase aspartic, catalytic [Tanacetum cinerariifolium]
TTFTLVGNVCSLTRITKTAIVPLRKPIPLESNTSKPVVVQIVLWYLDSGCSKHMTGDRSQLTNFVNIFLGTVKFGNDHVAKIMGYGDYKIENVTISRVYSVEGLGHNLFSVGQFCDSDLEVAFRQHTCFIRNLEGVDLLTGSKGNNLYTLSLGDMLAKKKSHKPKSEDTNQEKLYLLHMDLCGPMRYESVNGKKYILVIVDDYSRFTWVKCLRSKDEALGFIIKFLKMIQVRLKVPIRQAVATACYTQNRSIVRVRHGKTPYELLHNKLPDLSFLHVFGALCYPTNDSENLGKLQPKADIGIFIGYAPTKKKFRIYNIRTRRIVETIHVDFDELKAMTPATITPEVIAPIDEVVAPELAESTGSPSSTTADQDAPSPSKSQTTPETQPPIIPQDVEEDNHDIEVHIWGMIRYLARPTEKYVHAVKRIFRYLRGTVHQGLWYPKDSSVALTSFADADHAGCQDTHCSTSGSVTMDMKIDQQVALDEALVPYASRLRIGKSNFLLRSDITSKESTLQLVYDVLRLTPFCKAFLVTTDVPEIYMQEFWATATVHHHSIHFKMDNRKRIVSLEYFREMMHICPRLPGQTFDELPFEEEILAFLRFLRHSGEIRKLTDVNINKLHQP